jgi:hypothetical protein
MQALAETGKQEAISRPPVRPLDPALEDARAGAGGPRAQAGGRRPDGAIDEGLEKQTEDRVAEGEKHGRPSWQVDACAVQE